MKEYIFTKETIKDGFIKWWQFPLLWFIPTQEQWTDEGFVVRYKIFREKIYIVKLGKLTIS